MSKGCTIALIIVAVIVVLIIIGGIVVWLNKDKIIEAGVDLLIGQVETEIVSNLPPGYTEESVHQIMQEFKKVALAGELDESLMRELPVSFTGEFMKKEIKKSKAGETKGSVTITYSDYHVNEGIDDGVFNKQNREKN